jgi:hypothetical protein
MNLFGQQKKARKEIQEEPEVLKSRSSRRQALQLLSPKWLLVVTEYVAWNIANYTVGNQSEQYYNIYYLGERLFVVLAFFALIKSVHKRFVWVIKVMMALAIFKLIYILCFIAKIIPLNQAEHISLIGFVFIGATAIIIFKWGRA